MLKLESIITENITTANKLGFSYEFNKNDVTCICCTDQKKLIDFYNILLGFKKPKSGKIFIDEFCYNDLSNYQKSLVFGKTTSVIDTIMQQEHYLTINQSICRYLKLLGKSKKEIKENIYEAAALFNLTSELNKKIISLTSEQKLLYLVAKAFAAHNSNIIINVDLHLIFTKQLQTFFIKQIEKLQYQKNEIIILTNSTEFSNNFSNIINFDEIDNKNFALNNLLVETPINLKKIHFHPKSYFYAMWILLSANIPWIIISWFFAIVALFSCFLLGNFISINGEIVSGSTIAIIITSVFFCIILIALFIIIVFKIYRQNGQNLNFYQSLSIPKQVIFSILPVMTAIYILSSVVIALLLYLCFSPVVFETLKFNWSEIWITVVVYFLIFMFTSLITSLSLLSKIDKK